MGGRALSACAGFFASFCSPCPLRCSAQALGFVFLGFAFALVCFGSVWGITMHFRAWFFLLLFCCCVQFSFLFRIRRQPRTRRGHLDLERLSGGAGWRVSWLLQPSEFGLFWRLFCAFFLRCLVWAFALPKCLPAPS